MKIEALEASSFPEPLKEEWEALLYGCHYPNPFLTPAWNEIWLRHFGSLLKLATEDTEITEFLKV